MSTWTLLAKVIHLRSCWIGLVELATARKTGPVDVVLGGDAMMGNTSDYARIKTRSFAQGLFMEVLLYSPEAACHDLARSLGISER